MVLANMISLLSYLCDALKSTSARYKRRGWKKHKALGDKQNTESTGLLPFSFSFSFSFSGGGWSSFLSVHEQVSISSSFMNVFIFSYQNDLTSDGARPCISVQRQRRARTYSNGRAIQSRRLPSSAGQTPWYARLPGWLA